MQFYELNLCGLRRDLPLVAISPKVKIASFNLLGDRELVESVAQEFARNIDPHSFDLLVGPEVKVVPLLQELSRLLKKGIYVVCRKQIHGYMVNPVRSSENNGLVINGPDAGLIRDHRVILVDDVVTTGATINILRKMIEKIGGRIVSEIAVLKQGDTPITAGQNITFLGHLPFFDEDGKEK